MPLIGFVDMLSTPSLTMKMAGGGDRIFLGEVADKRLRGIPFWLPSIAEDLDAEWLARTGKMARAKRFSWMTHQTRRSGVSDLR